MVHPQTIPKRFLCSQLLASVTEHTVLRSGTGDLTYMPNTSKCNNPNVEMRGC